jgi:hypothetical protein
MAKQRGSARQLSESPTQASKSPLWEMRRETQMEAVENETFFARWFDRADEIRKYTIFGDQKLYPGYVVLLSLGTPTSHQTYGPEKFEHSSISNTPSSLPPQPCGAESGARKFEGR